jgi:acyl-coenzyme A thioesterase PaaI-like protein
LLPAAVAAWNFVVTAERSDTEPERHLRDPAEGLRPHELHADERAHFISTMGFEHSLDRDGTGHGTVTIGPYLTTGPGWPSAAALLTFADILIGSSASRHAAPRISVTAELSVRVVGALPDDGRLEMRSELVKTGRTMSVGETELVAAGSGRLVALAVGTFLASPRPQDVAPDGLGPRFANAWAAAAPAGPTLAEHVGLRVVEPGFCVLALRPDLFNATESLQGGLVALLGEIAAQSASSAAAGEPHVVDSLDVRYLAAARVGPFHARAHLLAPALARVEIRDSGSEDRTVSLILARTRPFPA